MDASSRLQAAGVIPGALFEAARRFGDRIALVDDEDRVSFADLARETVRAAKACIALGLKKGDVVGVWAPNMWRWVAAAAGAQSVGAVLIPLNTRLRAREVARAAARARMQVLVCVGRFLGQDYPAMLQGHDLASVKRIVVFGETGSHDPRIQSWDAFLASGDHAAADAVTARLAELHPEDLSDIMFTSGTTGEPKGAMFSHARSLRAAAAWLSAAPLGPGSRYLGFGPFSHTAGYKAGWIATLLSGCTLYARNLTDPVSLMRLISEERISVMPAPPAILQAILADPRLGDFDLSSLEFISTGAAAVPMELVRRLKNEVGVDQMATGYGLTEGGGTSTMTRRGDPLELVANSAGCAVEGVEARHWTPSARRTPKVCRSVRRCFRVQWARFSA